MAKGTFAATATSSIVLAADPNRETIEIQHTSGDPLHLGFGEAAVFGEGIKMSSSASYYRIADARAQLALHMICDAGNSAGGGYQTT